MNKMIFDSYEQLVDEMFNVANQGGTAYAICFIDDANEIVKELLSRKETAIAGITMAPPDYNGYEKEYFISLDGDMLVDVQPAWYKKTNENGKEVTGYLWFDGEAAFVVGDANSAVIKCIDKSKCTEIEFDFSTDEVLEELISGTHAVHDENGEVIGFAVELDTLMKFFLGE